MSYQVLRVEKFQKKDLLKIGAETERTAKHHRNEDIDRGRTPLNYYFKKSEGGLSAQWKKVVKNFGASFHETKKAIAFEGIIVTSDTAFFEKLGWIRGHPTPDAVKQFFCDCYDFILREIGYHGGDENILSAVVHMDETTPHLQLYYVPLVDEGRKKVYAKGADGKVLRNERGSPIQAKDSRGKSLYEYVPLENPKICSSDLWEMRGSQLSFGNLQDPFKNESAGGTDWSEARSEAIKSTRPNINGKSNSRKKSWQRRTPHLHRRILKSKKRTGRCRTRTRIYPRQRKNWSKYNSAPISRKADKPTQKELHKSSKANASA